MKGRLNVDDELRILLEMVEGDPAELVRVYRTLPDGTEELDFECSKADFMEVMIVPRLQALAAKGTT